MNQNWSDAARLYTGAEETKQRLEKSGVKIQEITPTGVSILLTGIAAATRELEAFLQSADGVAARSLLKASKCHIIFGEENEGGGYGIVYFFDGNGLQQSIEAMGMWVVYAKSVPEPKLSPIDAATAIQAAVNHSGKKAEEIMKWLRHELDTIAARAPGAS